MASGDIKGFYRQRKSGGISKSSSSKASNSKKSSSITRSVGASLLGSDPATISHASLHHPKGDYDTNEEVLRQFDLNMNYGPCLGLSRLERWERANKLGLNPPEEVENLLRGSQDDHSIYLFQIAPGLLLEGSSKLHGKLYDGRIFIKCIANTGLATKC
ncbi:hypothetical protein MRB53_025231 [Persea americana]|uniref:Uncharacterized protein n=1 Tax=Persea americana TaxID=3435 RepID=A0ACC2LF58_PERAE|nr:hypothetical protein MRB53_025231 [Persea americana]